MISEIPGADENIKAASRVAARIGIVLQARETNDDVLQSIGVRYSRDDWDVIEKTIELDRHITLTESPKRLNVGCYTGEIILAALKNMGVIGPGFDLERFEQEVNSIRDQVDIPPTSRSEDIPPGIESKE